MKDKKQPTATTERKLMKWIAYPWLVIWMMMPFFGNLLNEAVESSSLAKVIFFIALAFPIVSFIYLDWRIESIEKPNK